MSSAAEFPAIREHTSLNHSPGLILIGTTGPVKFTLRLE
jgi:hypothetical protein